MARLMVKTTGLENQLIELKLGTNSVGRSPDVDFKIQHPTVSSLHCELVLGSEGVLLRDLESTNGTFVDGSPVREIKLTSGQTVRLGDVELFVESTEAKVAIPTFLNEELLALAPPVVSPDGATMCARHPQARVTHRCTRCQEEMCGPCVHRLKRKGGKNVLTLCPLCGGHVEPLEGAPKPKKKSLLARVGETVRLKLTRVIHLGGGRQ